MASDVEKYDADKEAFFKEFKELRPDLFMSDVYKTNPEIQQEAEGVVRDVSVRSEMLKAIPLRCKGPDCVYASTCPLQQKKIAPVGQACPIELSLISEMVYSLARELSVPLDQLHELAIIRDLVDQEIQHIRASKILAMEEMIQEYPVGVDRQGEVVNTKTLHLASEMQERILKRKKDIRNQLMATREQKAKIGLGGIAQTQNAVADVLEGLREVEIQKDDLLRRKLGKPAKDDYITAHEDESSIVDAEVVEEKNPFENF